MVFEAEFWVLYTLFLSTYNFPKLQFLRYSQLCYIVHDKVLTNWFVQHYSFIHFIMWENLLWDTVGLTDFLCLNHQDWATGDPNTILWHCEARISCFGADKECTTYTLGLFGRRIGLISWNLGHSNKLCSTVSTYELTNKSNISASSLCYEVLSK